MMPIKSVLVPLRFRLHRFVQDPTGGLQVLNSAGEWIDAPPIEGTFLINVGDMLERWTNGLFVSTIHRVINRAQTERYSSVFCRPQLLNGDCLPTQLLLPKNPAVSVDQRRRLYRLPI